MNDTDDVYTQTFTLSKNDSKGRGKEKENNSTPTSNSNPERQFPPTEDEYQSWWKTIPGLEKYTKQGFKLVPLDKTGHPNRNWVKDGIYSDPEYWIKNSIAKSISLFENVAIVPGPIMVDGELWQHVCLEFDADEEHNTELYELLKDWIEETKTLTFVVKTRKTYGYHIHWLTRIQNTPIGGSTCKNGVRIELKTDNTLGLVTIPPSNHKNDKNFYYKHVGRIDTLFKDKDNKWYNFLRYDKLQQFISEDKLKEKEKKEQYKEQHTNNQNSSINNNRNSSFSEVDEKLFKQLSETQMLQLTRQLRPFYKENYRDPIWFSFSARLAYASVILDSALLLLDKVYDILSDDPEDYKSRITTIRRSYERCQKGEHNTAQAGLKTTFMQACPEKTEAEIDLVLKNITDIIYGNYVDEDEQRRSQQRESEQESDYNFYTFDPKKHKENEIILGVTAARLINTGAVTVKGMIGGMSIHRKLYKDIRYRCLECNTITEGHKPYRPQFSIRGRYIYCINCQKPQLEPEYNFANTIIVEIKDIDNNDIIASLPVVLFENDITKVHYGETVVIRGIVYTPVDDALDRKLLLPYLFAKTVELPDKKDVNLTEDRKEFWKKFIKEHGPNTLNKLIELYCPNIIGNDIAKKIIILSQFLNNTNILLPKITFLLIGPPGWSKTEMLRNMKKLSPRNTYTSAEGDTKTALTGMIEKSKDGSKWVRLGIVLKARGGTSIVNEVGHLSLEDQPSLISIASEQISILGRYDEHEEIPAPISLAMSANPKPRSKSQPENSLDYRDSPLFEALNDRVNFKIPVIPNREEENLRKITKEKIRTLGSIIDPYAQNYEDLAECILYVQEFCPWPKTNLEIETIIFPLFKQIVGGEAGKGSPRILEGILKLTLGFAKMYGHEQITEQDAIEATGLYGEYHKLIENTELILITGKTEERVYEHFLSCLKENSSNQKSLEDLTTLTTVSYPEAEEYLGPNPTLNTSRKLERIKDKLLLDPLVVTISQRPYVFVWNNSTPGPNPDPKPPTQPKPEDDSKVIADSKVISLESEQCYSQSGNQVQSGGLFEKNISDQKISNQKNNFTPPPDLSYWPPKVLDDSSITSDTVDKQATITIAAATATNILEKEVLRKYLKNSLSIDFEWDYDKKTGEPTKMTWASFSDYNLNTDVKSLADFNGNENHFLAWVKGKLKISKYDTILSYNGTGTNSDFHVVQKRLVANQMLNDVISEHTSRKGYLYFKVVGKNNIDVYKIYDNPVIKSNHFDNLYGSSSLDEVSTEVLPSGIGGKYKGWTAEEASQKSIEEQRNYNKRDAELTMLLAKHKDAEICDAFYELCKLIDMPFTIVCNSKITTWWQPIYDRIYKDSDTDNVFTRIWTDKEKELYKKQKKKYVGATVLLPKPGFYDSMICMDVASLYPSVAILYNLSFDTVNCPCCINDPEARITIPEVLEKCKYADKEKGYWICRKKVGVFPEKLKVFRSQREAEKILKKEMKEKGLDANNNGKITAYKILMNGGYGVFGAPEFPYFDPRTAELITAYGRYKLLLLKEVAEKEMGINVLYADTDSLFFTLPPEDDKDNIINKLIKESEDRFNVQFELKDVYQPFFLSKGKKHYVGVATGENPTAIIKGMEGKKKDRSRWINKVFRRFIDEIFIEKVDPEDSLRTAIYEIDHWREIIPPDQLKKRISSLQKEPEEYAKSLPQHVLGIQENLKRGDSLSYYLVKRDKKEMKGENRKYPFSMTSTNLDEDKYKELLWNCISEVLYRRFGYDYMLMIKNELFPNIRIKTKKK